MSSTSAVTTVSFSTNTVAGWPLRMTAVGEPCVLFATIGEIARGTRMQEPVCQLPAMAHVRIEALRPLLDPAPGAGAQLAARRGGAPERTGHFLEGIAENVMQEIRRAFERRQLLQEHQERQRQRIGLLGSSRVLDNDGFGQPGPAVAHPLRPSGAELVQTKAGHDGHQVGAYRIDRLVAAPEPADPRLLEHVLGVGRAPEHPIRDAEEK